jgi:hypothetical protein
MSFKDFLIKTFVPDYPTRMSWVVKDYIPMQAYLSKSCGSRGNFISKKDEKLWHCPLLDRYVVEGIDVFDSKEDALKNSLDSINKSIEYYQKIKEDILKEIEAL